MTHTTQCAACGESAIGYVQHFQGLRKAGSYPACPAHYAMAWAYQELGQEWIRDALADLLPLRRGAIPRFKVSLKP